MSNILSRFKAIFQAQAHAVADQMEDPKAGLDYSLTKLEENRRQITRSLIDVRAARRRLQKQRDDFAAAAEKHAGQARSAVDADREDLARTALERKQAAAARVDDLNRNIANLDRQIENLTESQQSLGRKIETFRARKEELKALHDSAQAQIQVREALGGISEDLADVGNTIHRAEARIQEMQSRADAIDALVAEGVLDDVLEPAQDDLDRELARIGRKQAVDAELARLKEETNRG